MPHTKHDLIQALRETAMLLELKGENAFRCRAYENGARVLDSVPGEPETWLQTGALEGVKGIGKGLIGHIEEWVKTGGIELHSDLKKEIPEGVLQMLEIPGMGAKKAKTVWEKLGVDSIEKLEAAARDGQIAALAGFGEKTAAKILAGIELTRKFSGRFRIDTAREAAESILEILRNNTAAKRVELGGSCRRWRETIGDLDFLVESSDAESVMNTFISMPMVASVVNHGPTKSSVVLSSGIPADLRVVEKESFAAALNYFTGNKEHNTNLRGRAKKMGLKLNEYGLFKEGSERGLPMPNEPSIYEKLGLRYIEPEMREDMGEIELAEAGELPNLIKLDDMRGLLHCHSTYSDGHASLEQMIEGARAAGYLYFGICDHSQSAAYARGLKKDAVLRQHDDVDALNEKLKGFRVLKGIESDILGEGELDYPDALLEKFDFVVISVHSRFQMDRDAMTKRICRAISHPAAAILGHPTGRLLLERDPYQVDLEQVFETAAKHKVAIEINASPHRLDLDWREIRNAKKAGCIFSINPDAHSVPEIGNVKYGVGIARKGWLEAADVINTKTLAEFRRWLKSRGQPGGPN